MGDTYYNLRHKLDELGYNNKLPLDAVPLVECLLADLLQTTQSLQYYMDLSKGALQQRDSLVMEAEPYKNENNKLLQENNKLHKEYMLIKEEYNKLNREYKRKVKFLSDELQRTEALVSKLKHDVRDLSLRGLCAKSRRSEDKQSQHFCLDKNDHNPDVEELKNKIFALEESNQEYVDEIMLLKNQVEHRNSEIVRLTIMLEGGRPVKQDISTTSTHKMQQLHRQIQEFESENMILKSQLDKVKEKQHEAMMQALNLADKNKILQDEIRKVDALALKVEDDCNKKLAVMINEKNILQTKLDHVITRNTLLEQTQTDKIKSSSENSASCDSLNRYLQNALKEKDTLKMELDELKNDNKTLQDTIKTLERQHALSNLSHTCPTKDEMQKLLESERKLNEEKMLSMQKKFSEATDILNKHFDNTNNSVKSTENRFIKNLQIKLCEKEQKLLMMQKEIDDLNLKLSNKTEDCKQNYKDIIKQLNEENSELSQENISLTQQLAKYRNIDTKNDDVDNYLKIVNDRLKSDNRKLQSDLQVLTRDKKEYNNRYKDALEMAEKYKRDLVMKQNEVEQLTEENNSYKLTHRSGKASADHLREEISFLREQIKRMQSDVVREKTLANQLKNMQVETERSTNEMHNEVLTLQKKLSLSKDNIESLEKKCRDLQTEMLTIKNEKSSLIDTVKKLDQDRDKLVLELDHKTESNCILEQKIKAQSLEIEKLEDKIAKCSYQLNLNKVSEHKVSDYEAQIKFLNSEITKLTSKYENTVIENKHLHNSLADVNGNLKVNQIEYQKSRKEVEELRQQLQHYVAEIRRIEELLSHKEAERSDMLENFASLSVEANILENTNHSLESESASKSLQLQNYIVKIQDLESKILDKENIIDNQSTRIANLLCKITSLENEVKLIREEKLLLEQNVACLKQMCNNLQMSSDLHHTSDSEFKLYENKIKGLSSIKSKLELENEDLRDKFKTSELLLSNARKEIIDLKLALQDAITETTKGNIRKSDRSITTFRAEVHERSTDEQIEHYESPMTLREAVHEDSQEDDDIYNRTSTMNSINELHKRFSKYTHGSTL